MSWLADAKSEAKETAHNFLEEIIEGYISSGEASDDLNNDYSDSYHHENHVDRSYKLTEAAELLDELSEYEETDAGLWQGSAPRDAICVQAAFTYGNAVYSLWSDIIKEINDDDDLAQLLTDYEAVDATIAEEIEEARQDFDGEDEAFEPPFDEDEEAERRTSKLRLSIQNRITEIINDF